MNKMQMHERLQHKGWFQSNRTQWILFGFLAVAAFFLLTEHTAHFLGVLPYLIFLLCPLMMLFMMRGGHGNQNGLDNQGPHDSTDSHQGHGRSGYGEQPPEGGIQ